MVDERYRGRGPREERREERRPREQWRCKNGHPFRGSAICQERIPETGRLCEERIVSACPSCALRFSFDPDRENCPHCGRSLLVGPLQDALDAAERQIAMLDQDRGILRGVISTLQGLLREHGVRLPENLRDITPLPPIAKPIEIEYDTHELEDGTYAISAYVQDKENRPVRATVILRETVTGEELSTQRTDDLGRVRFTGLEVTGRARRYDLIVHAWDGTVQTKEVTVVARPPRVEPPEFSEEELQGGPLSLIRNALRRRQRDRAASEGG